MDELRDLVTSWRELAAMIRQRAESLDATGWRGLADRDRLLAARDVYLRCADELDRRIHCAAAEVA